MSSIKLLIFFVRFRHFQPNKCSVFYNFYRTNVRLSPLLATLHLFYRTNVWLVIVFSDFLL